jgi:hypothetical protein
MAKSSTLALSTVTESVYHRLIDPATTMNYSRLYETYLTFYNDGQTQNVLWYGMSEA